MTIRHGKSTSVISNHQPIRDADFYMIAVDDRHVEAIATDMRITVGWFRRRYLTFNRDTNRWSIRVTGAYLKERLAQAEDAHLRRSGGLGTRTDDEREDEQWQAKFH